MRLWLGQGGRPSPTRHRPGGIYALTRDRFASSCERLCWCWSRSRQDPGGQQPTDRDPIVPPIFPPPPFPATAGRHATLHGAGTHTAHEARSKPQRPQELRRPAQSRRVRADRALHASSAAGAPECPPRSWRGSDVAPSVIRTNNGLICRTALALTRSRLPLPPSLPPSLPRSLRTHFGPGTPSVC